MSVDIKLDKAIAKQCYLEKKYQLLPEVVIPTIAFSCKNHEI